MIYTPDGTATSQGSKTKRGRGRRRPQKDEPKDEEKPSSDNEEKEEVEGEEKKSGGPSIKIPNPLILIHSFFNAWKNIQMSYNWDQNVANSFVTDMPKWDYQFGFTQKTGVDQDVTFTGGDFQRPATTDKKSLRTSLSFDGT